MSSSVAEDVIPYGLLAIYLYALTENSLPEIFKISKRHDPKHRQQLMEQQLICKPCQPLERQEEQDRECAICLASYEAGETIACTKACQHEFHQECLAEWLKYHDQCPMCRKDVLFQSDASTSTGRIYTQTLASSRPATIIKHVHGWFQSGLRKFHF